MKPGKHQESGQRSQDLSWKVPFLSPEAAPFGQLKRGAASGDENGKVHDRVQSLFCIHTLCMNYVAKTFLLVRSSV